MGCDLEPRRIVGDTLALLTSAVAPSIPSTATDQKFGNATSSSQKQQQNPLAKHLNRWSSGTSPKLEFLSGVGQSVRKRRPELERVA